MKLIRTLICDDERLARNRLKNALKNEPDIFLLEESSNGLEALDTLKKKQVDVLFLDIQMPDMNGFDVLKHLSPDETPYIIFVTAYDHFAIKAFEIHALDYLLKPFDNQRFKETLTRVRKQFEHQSKLEFNEQLTSLMKLYPTEPSAYLNVIEIKEHNTIQKIVCKDILYFQSYSNYIKTHTLTETHLYRSTMNELENRLDKHQFLRIHRSIIVNVFYLTSITYRTNNEYEVRLSTGKSFLSGRSYSVAVSEFVKQLK